MQLKVEMAGLAGVLDTSMSNATRVAASGESRILPEKSSGVWKMFLHFGSNGSHIVLSQHPLGFLLTFEKLIHCGDHPLSLSQDAYWRVTSDTWTIMISSFSPKLYPE